MSILELSDVHTYYGDSHVLHGVSFQVGEREVVSLLGRNGSGKTTTLRTIMGLTPPGSGSIRFRGEEMAGRRPHAIFRCGIRLVPQGRGIFPSLTVEENLRLAMTMATVEDEEEALEQVYQRFPIFKERRRQKGRTLSGGQLQMLAIARAIVGETGLILMDEPSEGLAPLIVREILGLVVELKEKGATILLAEQNLKLAMAAADRHYIIEKGVVKFEGTTADLEEKEEVIRAYLGVYK